jgi:mono/diheme cytochrome c family protein
MPTARHGILSALLLLLACALPALAQDAATQRAAAAAPAASASAPAAPPHPGRELTMSKCFQCHTESIWRDQRLDARGWEATLYRMVARGALWSGEDIRQMAAFLSTDYGRSVPRFAPRSQP